MEMAGIEPASESIVPRKSTSVVACLFSPIDPQTTKENNQLAAGARKLLFRTISGVLCGTPALCRPDYDRLESGVGGRDSTRSQTQSLTAYAASGRAETLVRFALIVCADLSRSAPLDSHSGVSHFRRSPSSPLVPLYLKLRFGLLPIVFLWYPINVLLKFVIVIYSVKLFFQGGVTI